MSIECAEDAFQGSVTVGERGQVVIPAEAREKLGIHPGEKLLVFCHPSGAGVFFGKVQQLQHMLKMLTGVLESPEVVGEDAEKGV